jgi:hypothetical protein
LPETIHTTGLGAGGLGDTDPEPDGYPPG